MSVALEVDALHQGQGGRRVKDSQVREAGGSRTARSGRQEGQGHGGRRVKDSQVREAGG